MESFIFANQLFTNPLHSLERRTNRRRSRFMPYLIGLRQEQNNAEPAAPVPAQLFNPVPVAAGLPAAPIPALIPRQPPEMIEPENVPDVTNNQGRRICVVCLGSPATRALVPCGHFCLCEFCSTQVASCPLCRDNFASIVVIF